MIQLIGREGVTVTDGILDGDQEKKNRNALMDLERALNFSGKDIGWCELTSDIFQVLLLWARVRARAFTKLKKAWLRALIFELDARLFKMIISGLYEAHRESLRALNKP